MKFKPLILAGATLALLVLFFTTDIFKGGRDMTEHTFETRTWCVGRFLVDVPKQFEIRPSGHTFDAVRVTALGQGTTNDLKRIVEGRIAELQAGIEEGGAVRKLREHHMENSLYMVSYMTVIEIDGYVDEFYDAEAYFLKDDQMFKTIRLIDTLQEASDHAALIRVSQAVRPRANDEIPEGVGACIKDAFVALPPMNESSKAIFRDKDAEDLNLSIYFSHVFNSPKVRPIEKYSYLAANNRKVAGYDGYEHYAVYFRQADGETSYLDHEYIGGKATPVGGDGVEINISLSKYSGEPNDLPYDEAVSRMIWNGVLNSIRERGVK